MEITNAKTGAGMEAWLFFEQGRESPAWNMACDEWLLQRAGWLGAPILRTYAWDRPSVTIGYFQPFPANLPAYMTVIRRPTGGAMVVHDTDITFSVIVPGSHPWRKLPAVERYNRIHERVGRVFETRGLQPLLASCGGAGSARAPGESRCFSKATRHDVLIDGIKVVGGAQRTTREGMLHQGSIQGGGHWRVSPDELRRAWETLGARFTGLRLAADEMASVTALATAKYSTRAWNQRVM